jgi:uncharacterized membrane-anchored protein
MRRLLLLVCIIAQIGVLAFMVFSRESIVTNGSRIVVRTAPVDPTDPFRGDYVRLRYLMNRSRPELFKETLEDGDNKAGQIVYAILEERPGGVYELRQFSLKPPVDEVFIKGRFASEWGGFEGGESSFIKYGIEQMFVEQGAGILIEDRQGLRSSMQTAMEVELAVAADGTAVLVGHQWADFAIAVDVQRPLAESANETETETLPLIAVTIQNVSETAQALFDSEDQCSFSLQAVVPNENRYRPAYPTCQTRIADERMIVLQPGEQYQLDMNLASKRWQMIQTDNNGEQVSGDIREIAREEAFRIVYSTPPAFTSASASTTVPVWQGELISQSFNTIRVID